MFVGDNKLNTKTLALALIAAGFSVIPIVPEGKAASVPWRPFQTIRMVSSEVDRSFAGNSQIAVICGEVSGGLEVIDFDTLGTTVIGEPSHFTRYIDMLNEHGFEDLVQRLVIVRTPSNGRHIYFRCKGHTQGNQKLANTAKPINNKEVMIETRGEGGYVLTAPSKGYDFIQGSILAVPEITADERNVLMTFAMVQNQKIVDMDAKERVSVYGAKNDRPGDEYTKRENNTGLLNVCGYGECGKSVKGTLWVRPGKTIRQGLSGILFHDTGVYYNFSSNDPDLSPMRGYSKFSLYVALAHHGDLTAATKAAAEMYGMASTTKPRTQYIYEPSPKTEVELSDMFGSKKLSAYDKNELPEFGICGKYILCNHYNLIDGQGAIGKSTLLMAIAAFGSRGHNKFTQESFDPFRTLYFSTEDDGPALLRTYLFFGGDPDMIELVEKPIEIYGKDTLTFLSKKIVREEFKFWVLDPAITYMPAAFNAIIPKHVNDFTMGLKQIARETRTAPTIIRHFAKGAKLSDMEEKGSGSTAWRDYCRSQLVLVRNPDNKDERIVVHGKPSMGVPEQVPFGFCWDGPQFSWIMPGRVGGELGERGK